MTAKGTPPNKGVKTLIRHLVSYISSMNPINDAKRTVAAVPMISSFKVSLINGMKKKSPRR